MGVSTLTSASVSATVARTGIAKLVPAIEPATLVAQTDESLKPLVARLNVHSFAVVPIRARQTTIGTLSLMRSGPGRGYSFEDLTLLQDLADRAGLAIENARLYGELERRVRQRTAELELANEGLEAFSSSVAHDLRAPLRWIDGFAQALLEDQGERLDEQGRHQLDRIRQASQRMAMLVDDLLSLSRISRAPVVRERIDLGVIGAEILAELRQRDRSRQVTVEISPGLEANADPALVAITLQNLLGNAWKFTAKHAEARIQLGRTSTATGPAFFVRDDGAGFDMAYAPKLFQPFQRLHGVAEFEGTGIGLATVHRIVSRHGGRIWGEGAPGKGATFYFTLGA
jgi:light-regulated signal transduction histidine kinase (bacteriophytochrome)